MRIVSFVPSFTETFLEAGVEVVGRTRFCIHPPEAQAIPIVGGTKDGDWEKVRGLKPDLVIFDREENTREMAQACGVPFLSTHVTSMPSLAAELRTLSGALANRALDQYAERAEALLQAPFIKKPLGSPLTNLPEDVDRILYLIWRNPWMAVSSETFIGSVCGLSGFPLPQFADRYPKIKLEDFSKEKTLLLLSSEPFPFHRYVEEIKSLGFPAILVNGENFSWFGIRSIRYLESLVSPS